MQNTQEELSHNRKHPGKEETECLLVLWHEQLGERTEGGTGEGLVSCMYQSQNGKEHDTNEFSVSQGRNINTCVAKVDL